MDTIEPKAYTIPLLHCAKYPASQVNGLLLGRHNEKEQSIVTAVPLFHHWTYTTPMLDTALGLVETLAKQRQLDIVGCYQANQHYDDQTLHTNITRIADAIRQRSQHAVIFMLDNVALSSQADPPPCAIKPWTYQQGQWKLATPVFANDATVARARAHLEAGNHDRIIDFDRHLDDLSLDWLHANDALVDSLGL